MDRLTPARNPQYSPGCADDDIIDAAVDALRERGHDVDPHLRYERCLLPRERESEATVSSVKYAWHLTGYITIDGQLLAAEQFIEWAWANIDNWLCG